MNAAARDAARALRHFTRAGFASRLGITEPQAKPLLAALERRDVITRLGHVHLGGRGRPPVLFAYIDTRTLTGPTSRPTSAPDVARVLKRQPVSGRRVTSGHKDIDNILRAVEASGGRVERAGHGYAAYPPDGGKPVTLPSSKPNKGHLKGARGELRKRGVAV
jgi:hypothetical protein